MDWAHDATGIASLLSADDYTIARQVILRGTAAVYFTAFLTTFNQFPALLGERGLTPAPRYIARSRHFFYPSLFRWRATPYTDLTLRIVCVIGMAAAASVVIGLPQLGPAWTTVPVFGLMWFLYLSIVTIGQRFYSFGWESMLCECGFIVGFLGSSAVAPPLLIIVFLRWLVIRLEFGAGMIKLRGDASWRSLTAMDYHHQTQPMPGPLSRWAHLKPHWWHAGETLGSHIVQLGAPWLLLLPQPIASIAACCIIATQLALVLTGNYAWLNWLTIVVAFSGISDSFLRWVAGGPWPGWGWEGVARKLGEAHSLTAASEAAPGAAGTDASQPLWWIAVSAAVFVFLVCLSVKPLKNLFSRRQLMNASFNSWHLVNAYGAFGSMTETRREFIIEGTLAKHPAGAGDEEWVAYQFRGKPGDVYRRSRQFAPYHLRLDWLMWFAALGSFEEAWFSRLLDRLLDADPALLELLRVDPFDGARPSAVRVRVFDYRYATRAERRETGQWWMREELGLLVGPLESGRGAA